MPTDYTTAGLIADTKSRGFIPAGSGLTTSDLLRVLTGQLRNYIPAFLKSIREEYLVAQLSVTVTAATVPIPVRACGVALRTIGWTLPDGTVRNLARVEPERRGDLPASGAEPVGFMFQGNNVILLPAVTSGTLVVSYQQRPGQLVLTTDCAEITGLEDGTTFDVDANPSTLAVGTLVDVVGGAPNFKLKAMDQTVVTNDSGHLELAANVPTDWAVGDWVCPATETCVPQIPLECFDLLAQAAALEIAQATGSTRLEAIRAGLKDLREQVLVILSPRADGSARPIISRSRLGRWV